MEKYDDAKREEIIQSLMQRLDRVERILVDAGATWEGAPEKQPKVETDGAQPQDS